MNSTKALLFTFVGAFVFLVLNLCKFNAEENVLPLAKKNMVHNGTGPNPKNDTEIQQSEVSPDVPTDEETSRDENILLPTIAPATPVVSSFILISQSDSIHSVLSTIKTKSEEKDQPLESNIKEDDLQAIRVQVDTQVDEVEFDTTELPKPLQPESSPQQAGKTTEIPDDEQKETSSEQSIDIMKLNIDQGLEGKDINMQDPEAVSKEQERMGTKESIGDSEAESRSDTGDTKGAEGSIEQDVPEKGILESFKDWKEKLETNGKKVVAEKVVIKPSTKKRSTKKTNYASYECGAKVIASNNEAENVGAILNENRDLYMLNPCSCSIWFVIELCEKVKAETIDVANFELFSSSPEKFNAYFSTRYPTREWEFGGNFTSKAEKSIQSFHITEEFYAKFVKIEMLSHFGKEHYCPLSLVRVFGRSEVEELDDSEDTAHEHDGAAEDPEANVLTKEEPSKESKDGEKNFLKSATDMVIGLVNKATKSFAGVDEKKLANGTVQGDLNTTENVSDSQTLDGEKTDSNEALKVIQIVETEETPPDESSNVDSKANPSSTEKNATESAPNLVIFLEGDDTDEESEAKHLTKNCVFYGEIHNNRCADPRKKFWIKFLFIHRMCPSISKAKRKAIISPLNTHTRDSLLNKKETEGNLSFIHRTIEPASSDVSKEKSVLELQNNASSSVGKKTIIAGTSSSLNDKSSSPKKSVAAGTSPPDQGNVSTATKVETVPKTTQTETTDLAKQVGDEAVEETKPSCREPVLVNPDLSQLLEAAESSRAKQHSEEAFNKETSSGASETKTTEGGHASVSTVPESQKNDEDGSNEHVDVLFINYDEEMKEGKAEVSGNDKKETTKNRLIEPDTQGLDKLEKGSSNDQGNGTKPPEKSTEISSDDHMNISNDHVVSSSTEPTNTSGVVIKSEVKLDSEATDSPGAEGGQKLATGPELVASETAAAAESKLEDSSSVELKSIAGMTSPIEPSFSQPVTVSLSSKKTSSDLDVGMFSSNISGVGGPDLPVSPAPVLEQSLESGMLTVRATKSPGDSRHEDNTPQMMSLQIEESFTVPTERLEMSKRDNAEKVAPSDASVKIGSGSFGNNKESAILKLKSRVKELETNLSLSTQYLEEMSKRYGTALEEQQKQFKLKITALNLTLIQNKEIMERQEKSLEQLTKQVILLSIQLKNLTEASKENNLKMTERYAFTCMVEVFIIIMILWSCMRRPAAAKQQLDQRRHSAPSAYSHHHDPGIKEASLHSMENHIDDQRPSKNEFQVESAAATRRRRQRKKSKGGDDSVFDSFGQIENGGVREPAMVSDSAGVLFSAGRGIFNGLTGAFTKQPKTQIASRRTRALVDVTGYENIQSFGRSRSLETVEEDAEIHPPQRHRSLDSIRAKKYSRVAARLSDKKRG